MSNSSVGNEDALMQTLRIGSVQTRCNRCVKYVTCEEAQEIIRRSEPTTVVIDGTGVDRSPTLMKLAFEPMPDSITKRVFITWGPRCDYPTCHGVHVYFIDENPDVLRKFLDDSVHDTVVITRQ